MRFVLQLLLGITLLGTSASAAELVWIEAEQFDAQGGWVQDSQFIDQVGSSYLLAGGFGTPVDDAVTRVTLKRGGEYRVWLRTKDWFPESHPGTFQLIVDGQPVQKTLGRSGIAGWQWEDAGVRRLAGQVEIRLHDLTGYYGRCDAIVLTTDLAWQPPKDVNQIAELRRQYGGVGRQVDDMPPHDVVVVGGGLAGCTAAVAAARNGMRVALIQNRPILGGNASSEILVPPVGAWAGAFREKYPLDPRETGFIEEYRTAGNQRVVEGKLYSKRLDRFVRQEPNIDLHLNTHATGVEMAEDANSRIAAVLAMNVHSGRRMRFAGKIFLDCSGDAVIGVAAGAEYRHGKEPKAMYNEPWAPDEPSSNTMGNGLKYFAVDSGEPQPFDAPDWAYKFPTCESFNADRHPRLPTGEEIGYQFKSELGGLRDTYADAEEIRDDLFRLIFGLWDHTKNHCEQHGEKASNCRLAWVGHVAGKRENRRLMGDYILTQNDIANQRMFPDRVAFGAWSVDDHYSAGFFHDGPTGRHFDGDDHHYKGVPFSIPFRCLYSKNVDNLMMAGRDISATHLGLSDTRVMLTCAILGHAAGTGAAMCVSEETTPRGIYQSHLAALQQQLLKEGAAIWEMVNTDPRDLARGATVTASSVRTHTSGELMAAANVINGLARAVGQRENETTNAWGPDKHLPGPHWVQLAWDTPVDLNVVHVSFQTADTAPSWFVVEAWNAGDWVRIAEVPNNRHRRHVLGLEPTRSTKLRVVMEKPAAIAEIRVYQESDDVVQSAGRAHRTMRLPDEGPWLPWADALPQVTPTEYEGFILEAEDAELHGHWPSSTWAAPFVGESYVHDNDSGKGQKTIRFRLDRIPPGRYQVRLAYKAHTNRASNARVTISTADGTTTATINQRKAPPIDGLFYPLGEYTIDATSLVEIDNADTDGYVVVDALQLVPVK